MKQIKYLLLFIGVLLMSVTGVSAKAIDASIKLVGRNTFGRELEIEVDCKDAGNSSCYITDAKWYYSDTNSTENGTEIAGENNTGGSGYKNYYISEKMVGKYIYVVATISTYDSDYESITLTDITDAENNVTAMVDDYIEYVENTGYSITATATYEVGASLTLKLNGEIDLESNSYYVYFSNGEKPNITQTKSGCEYTKVSEDDFDELKTVYKDGKIYVSDDWYLLKGYDKAYLVKQAYDKDNGGYYCEITEKPIEVKKPALPTLGNRFKFYLFTDEYNDISTFPLFPYYGKTGSHKINTKIGLINDKELLRKLAKDTNGSLSLLLEYAKTNNGTSFLYTDEEHQVDIESFTVKDGAYYYVYTSYENSDGLYRNIEDVTVVMGDHGALVNEVKWDSVQEEKIDTVWENFVNAVKGNELLKDNEDVTIEYDADSMDITADTIKITFNYSNGIVSYEAPENASDTELIGISLYQGILLEEFLENFKYNKEKALKYLEENPKLTIAKDGFEYVIKEIEYKDENAEISTDVFTTLKFDLINGLKNFNKQVDTPIPEEEAPKTGFWFGIGSLGILVTIGAIGICVNSKMRKDNKIVKL